MIPPTDRHVALFAAAYEVEVTPTNRRLLSAAILWSRCWRVGGAMVAVVAVQVIDLITHGDSDWGLVPLAIGCAAGGTIGEWVRPRPASTGRRTASLRRRGLTDYVRPWVVAAVAGFLVLAIACTATYAFLWPVDDASWPWAPRPQVLSAIVLGGVLLTGLTTLLGTAVARRPEPTGEVDMVAARHAVRSAALISLSGNAMMAAAGTAFFVGTRVATYGDGGIATLGSLTTFASLAGIFVGLMLSLRAIPRYAPFWRRLPPVPQAS